MALKTLSKFKPHLNISSALTVIPTRNVSMAEVKTESQHRNPYAKKVRGIPKALYGGRHTVTVLPGGGIGPELMEYVKQVFKAAGVPVDFEEVEMDPNSNDDLEYAITSIRRNGVALKGNVETRSMETGVTSRNVALRNELDLFVNKLHCRSYKGIPSRQKNLDIIVVRQNTEGEYAMLEHESVPGVVESMKIVTLQNAERVTRFAFEHARKEGRKKVTTVHKANIMKMSDGLFLETARRIAKEYPDLEHNDMIIDNCCMQLVSNPHQFDVMNMTNLYGTIVSNVICGLVGGAGLISGVNFGDHYAVFETGTRNTGTAIAKKNIANPVAMLNAGCDLLDYLGHEKHAKKIRRAITKTITTDKIHTPDLQGTASSTDVVEKVISNLDESIYDDK